MLGYKGVSYEAPSNSEMWCNGSIHALGACSQSSNLCISTPAKARTCGLLHSENRLYNHPMNKHARSSLVIAVLGIVTVAVAAVVVTVLGPSRAGAPERPAVSNQNNPVSIAPIALSNLVQNQSVSLPYQINGTAPGGWFFEATFPVRLLGQTNAVILETYAKASGDWMTPGPVAFTISLPANAYHGTATLVMSKNNASGEPQNDASVSLPIVIQ